MWDFIGVVVGILLYIGSNREELFWPMVIISSLIVIVMLFKSPPEGILAAGIGAIIVFITKIIPGFADDFIVLAIGALIPVIRIFKKLIIGIIISVIIAAIILSFVLAEVPAGF